MLVGVAVELAIAKVAAEQPKLPEMISDVLADVTDSSIGSNDDFLVFLSEFGGRRGRINAGAPHDPAAFVLPLSLIKQHATRFELLEGCIPEMQVQDLALAGEEVIFNSEAIHRLQMTAQNGHRDEVSDGCGLVIPFLDRMQHFDAPLQVLVTLAVPLEDAG